MLAEDLRQRAHKLEAIKNEAVELGNKIAGTHLEIKAKTSKQGVIYGSVNSIQIAEELQKLGFDIDRKIIQIKANVKEVGHYEAFVRLHREVIIPITFDVISENHAQDLETQQEEAAPAEGTPAETPVAEEDAPAGDPTPEA